LLVAGNPQTSFHVKISRSKNENPHRPLLGFIFWLSKGEFTQPVTVNPPYFKQAIDRY
jgi:hypothetical protein